MIKIKGTKALITDIERRKALPIIRALGEEGVKVIGISSHRFPLGNFSKYCSKVYLCSNYLLFPEKFLDELVNIINEERPNSFFPIEDEIIQLILLNKARIEKFTKFVLPDYINFMNAYDKWETITIAKDEGIPVPNTYMPNSEDEIDLIVNENPFKKYVIKPRKSSGSRGLVFVENVSVLKEKYLEVAKQYKRPMIQEMIPKDGKGFGVFILYDYEMQVRAIFGHKRLREYPIDGGPSTLRISHFDKDLIEKSLNLTRNMRLVGVSMVEFKENIITGEKVLMEVNPRFWGSLQLAIFSGVNFPVIYHLIALGEKPVPILDFKTDLLCRWLLPGDILNFLNNKNRFNMHPSFFDFFNKRQTDDILSLNDPLPVIGIIFEGLRKIIHGNK